jgi:hypothetical protein
MRSFMTSPGKEQKYLWKPTRAQGQPGRKAMPQVIKVEVVARKRHLTCVSAEKYPQRDFRVVD